MNELPDQFDVLMKDRFSDYQQDPPDVVWNNIQTGMGATPKQGQRRIAYFLIPAAASLLVIVTGVFIGLGLRNHTTSEMGRIACEANHYNARPFGNQGLDAQNSADNNLVNLPKNQQEIQSVVAQLPQQNPVKNEAQSDNQKLLPNQTQQVDQYAIAPEWQVVNSEEAATTAPHTFLVGVDQQSSQTTAPIVEHQQLFSRTSIDYIAIKSINEINTPLCSNLTPQFSKQSERLINHQDYTQRPDIYIGLKYTPGYRIGEDSKSSFTQGLALDFGLEESKFIVQTGVGIEFLKQKTDYLLTWNELKTTGAYQYVTHYAVDSLAIMEGDSVIGYIIRPIFHTTAIEIFDTVMMKKQASTEINYTYINIPLMIGYRVNCRNWALDLKAGASYTFQTGKKGSAQTLDDASSNTIDYAALCLSEERRKQWFSLIAAPEVAYFVTENLSLNVEPWFRYSLSNSAAAKDAIGSKPYTVGLNAGIKIYL